MKERSKEKETLWADKERVYIEVKGEWVRTDDEVGGGYSVTFVVAEENPVPVLYYDGTRSVLLTQSCAFPVGVLLASYRQARLWCDYHGFRFVPARIVPYAECEIGRKGCVRGLALRPVGALRYSEFAVHCQKCPDCQRAIRLWQGSEERVG